jgi:hypothetical protein
MPNYGKTVAATRAIAATEEERAPAAWDDAKPRQLKCSEKKPVAA